MQSIRQRQLPLLGSASPVLPSPSATASIGSRKFFGRRAIIKHSCLCLCAALLVCIGVWQFTGLHPRHWVGRGNAAKLHRLPAGHRNAVCLDGSPAAVFASFNDKSNNWVVYLGHDPLNWCIDTEDCYMRSRGPQGSSRHLPQYIELHGVLSNSADVNPRFHNWSKVVIHACDGSGFLGHRRSAVGHAGRQLHSRGHHVILAAVDWLRRQRPDWPRESEILFVGRGGSGVGLMSAAPRLLREFARNRVRFAIESGVLPSNSRLTETLKQVFVHHAVGDNPDMRECVESADSPWRCLEFHRLVRQAGDAAAFFFAGSCYDKWLAVNNFRIPCPLHDCRDDEHSLSMYNSLRDSLISTLEPIDKKSKKDGIWMCSCWTDNHLLHDLLFRQIFVESGDTRGQLSLSDSLTDWMDSRGGAMHHFIDNVHPSNPTCPVPK